MAKIKKHDGNFERLEILVSDNNYRSGFDASAVVQLIIIIIIKKGQQCKAGRE